jgi:hypothetical protein
MQYQMQVDPARRGFRSAVLAILLGALGGCSNEGDGPSAQALVGSVGDGPVVDALVTLTDAGGSLVSETLSDITANYAVDVPAGHAYPLTLTASGGTDLVTGRALDFTLRSVVLGPEVTRVNLSPITTLAVAVAACSSGAEVDAAHLETAFQTLAAELTMGLDPALVADPLHDEVIPATAAAVVLANEALAEALRRTQIALAATGSASDLDTLIARLGCDLTDGVVDGLGGESDTRIAATFYAASAEVMLELIAGSLKVDGQLAVSLLDQALQQIFPDNSTTLSVQDVPVTDALVQQTRDALAALQTGMDDEELTKYVVLLDESTSATASDAVSTEMTVEDEAVFASLAGRVALEEEATLDIQTNSSRKKKDALPPVMSFASNADSVVAGDSAVLSWASVNADRCLGKGDWSGRKAVDGTFATGPLNATAQYKLSCSGMGGSKTGAVTVAVATPTPAQPPVVNLSADTTSVSMGDSVVLFWSTSGADFCAALADWSGVKQLNGQETVGPLDADSSFTLSCDGPGGTSSDVVSVSVAATPPSPTLTLSASLMVVVVDGMSTLTWSATDANSCSASGSWSGTKGISGAEPVGPIGTDSGFGLTCVGDGGSVLRTVQITVVRPPTVAIGASPTSVAYSESTLLSWSSSDADECSASGDWTGSKATSGSESVSSLTATSHFIVTCSGAGGSASQSVTVDVASAPPTLTLSASPMAVAVDGMSTLTWSATDANSCSASGGWTGTKGITGAEPVGPIDSDSGFSLTCVGDGGSVLRTVQITVVRPPTVAIGASPTSVAYSESTLLSWSSSDADECSASGDWTGSKATSGSESILGLTAASNFILTCSGAGGSASQGVTVDVAAAPTDPAVSLSASEASVDPGADTTLIWAGTDVDSCDASGGWSGARAISGSEVVGPIDQDTTFSLTCMGPAGSAIAMTTVQVRAATLSWDAPVENVDGSPLTDLSGFRVYYGSASRNYDQSIEVADPLVTELVLNLSPGTYYFAMTAYDVDNNESAFSNEVSKTIQ